jgi:hypothetical protein
LSKSLWMKKLLEPSSAITQTWTTGLLRYVSLEGKLFDDSEAVPCGLGSMIGNATGQQYGGDEIVEDRRTWRTI